jgi:hypothetical protein
MSVLVRAGTEIVFCASLSDDAASNENRNTPTAEKEMNGFGLIISRMIFDQNMRIDLNRLSSLWLLLDPSAKLKMSRDNQKPVRIPLGQDNDTVTFGSLISPYQFKCAESGLFYNARNIYFANYNSFMAVNIDDSQLKLKRDHIDIQRGVVIDIKSPCNFIVYVCLRGNVDEYALPNRDNGMSPVFGKKIIKSCFFLLYQTRYLFARENT